MSVFIKDLLVCVLLTCSCVARVLAVTNETVAVVAAGGVSSGYGLETVWMAGQGLAGQGNVATVGESISSSSGQHDCSATERTVFLGVVQLVTHSLRDHDGDGILDENDLDDDNDGLSDARELAGGAFDPRSRTDSFALDSDGDGASDSCEAVAGTNPNDSGSYFNVISLGADASSVVEIAWNGRYGRSYRILRGETVEQLAASPEEVAVVEASAGLQSPPWYEGTEVYVLDDHSMRSLYRVSVMEP